MGFFILEIKMKEKAETKNGHNGHDTITVATFLDRKQVDYLDKIGKDCFFKFGHKISRGRILSELVDFLIDQRISCDKIDFENESLQEGLARLIKDGAIA
jgi:hypothetical protein